MTAQETSFQAFADKMVEHVLSVAEFFDIKVEMYFCLQQVIGTDPDETLAYMLRKDEKDAYLATDARGRIWYCDCTRQTARELTLNTDSLKLGEEILDALGCPAIGPDASIQH